MLTVLLTNVYGLQVTFEPPGPAYKSQEFTMVPIEKELEYAGEEITEKLLGNIE